MSEKPVDMSSLEGIALSLSRRRFLTTAGTGLVAAATMTDLPQPLLAQDAAARLSATPLPSIAFLAISAPTERETMQAPTTVPRDQRLGFAIVGLQMMVTHKSKTNPMMENFETRRLDEKDQFALEMDPMAECVVENKQPYTPGEEGLQDHHVMAAIYEAAHSGRPVRLPATDGLDVTRGSAPTPLP